MWCWFGGRLNAAVMYFGATFGFDSIPSDLGVYVLHEAAGGELGETIMAVRWASGGFSGGTIASGIGQMEAAKQDPEFRQQLLAQNLDRLLGALTKLRGAKAGKAESDRQIREGVDLAVKLSERLHALAGPTAPPSKARRG